MTAHGTSRNQWRLDVSVRFEAVSGPFLSLAQLAKTAAVETVTKVKERGVYRERKSSIDGQRVGQPKAKGLGAIAKQLGCSAA